MATRICRAVSASFQTSIVADPSVDGLPSATRAVVCGKVSFERISTKSSFVPSCSVSRVVVALGVVTFEVAVGCGLLVDVRSGMVVGAGDLDVGSSSCIVVGSDELGVGSPSRIAVKGLEFPAPPVCVQPARTALAPSTGNARRPGSGRLSLIFQFREWSRISFLALERRIRWESRSVTLETSPPRKHHCLETGTGSA